MNLFLLFFLPSKSHLDSAALSIGNKNYQSIALAFLAGGVVAIGSMIGSLYLKVFHFGHFIPDILMLGCFLAGLAITLLWL
ncbi:hypothetical protein [Metabacillus sp. RGM 3146]|uniref:hypothetical protein n=1 Tax=Metabacillus sp. RGM 3146 TaxID=3401092 RepID=UPI003B99C23C